MSKNIIADTLLNYNKMGILKLSQGNYEEALENFKESYLIENEMKLSKEKAKTLINIANTEVLLNEPKKALLAAQEALGIFEELACNQDYILTLLFIGRVYIFLGDFKNAEKTIYQVIKRSNRDDIKGEAYLSLHSIYIEDVNKYKAQDSITKSIQYFERSNKEERLKQALEKRAEFFQRINRNDLAWMDLNKISNLSSTIEF